MMRSLSLLRRTGTTYKMMARVRSTVLLYESVRRVLKNGKCIFFLSWGSVARRTLPALVLLSL